MKVLLLVMDGAGDVGKQTPLSLARKPVMERLASRGQVGLLDIGYKNTVDSDIGYLTLLGSYSRKTYPGRGYLSALAFPGLKIRDDDICIRGNFATLDDNGMLIDRRAGRDMTGLDELARKLDGMEIDGVRFIVKHRDVFGHRILIIMRGSGLSEDIVPNDPKKTGAPLPQVGAKNQGARKTASVLNRFLYRAHSILSKEKANKRRRFPANAILVRNAGRKKDSPGVQKTLGMKGCCIAGIPIAKGVARFLGMDVAEVPGTTGLPRTNLKGKFGAALKALERCDLVFLHVNGTDIASHDRDPELKREIIEHVDRELGNLLKTIDLEKVIVIVTCDHRTASSPEWKGYEHLNLPVPVLISGSGIRPVSNSGFSEASCEKGFRIKGNELILFALKMAKG